MNANLTAYYWAEQTNRQRLADQAARTRLAEEAAAGSSARRRVVNLCCAAETALVRLGARLQRIPIPKMARPLANQGGTPS